jgi:hypothetical protein
MPTHLEAIAYPKLNHVGFVVENMEAVGRGITLHFGLPAVVRRETLHFSGALYRDTRVSFAADFGYVELGNTSLELIQPVGSGPSPYRDVLQERGETMHHLAYVVGSIDERLLMAWEAGAALTIAVDGLIPDGRGRFVYVEGLVPGALIELLEYSERAR